MKFKVVLIVLAFAAAAALLAINLIRGDTLMETAPALSPLEVDAAYWATVKDDHSRFPDRRCPHTETILMHGSTDLHECQRCGARWTSGASDVIQVSAEGMPEVYISQRRFDELNQPPPPADE